MFWTLHYAGHRNLLIVNGGQRCVDAQENGYLFAAPILNHPNTLCVDVDRKLRVESHPLPLRNIFGSNPQDGRSP